MIATREKKPTTAEAESTAGRGRNGRFLPKSSGNTAGRPKGSRKQNDLGRPGIVGRRSRGFNTQGDRKGNVR